MKRRKREPGRVATAPPVKQSINDNGYTLKPDANLAVELGTAPTDEEIFYDKVLAQLDGLEPPGQILVILNPAHHSVVKDAASLARFYGEPVAIVDMEGRLLAYRTPQ